MKAMETVQDLIEEAKVRTVWWGLCIFSVTYFLTHTSKSMWMNYPMAILIVCGLRILFNQIEFRWKVLPTPRQSQLFYANKKQLSLHDARLSTIPPPSGWKKKIDSPVVEAAINDFIDKILNDFVINLWYSLITPDREAPELIRAVIMDAVGEISVRVKEINIVDLLTRDIFDLIGDHLESFRRNQADIGIDVINTLSSEEIDERLKSHLMVSGELYPALLSTESEYKVLQKMVAGILSVVLGSQEAQCPLVRTIAREIVTCLVIQPLLNLASPERINIIKIIVNFAKKGNSEKFSGEEQNVNSASSSAFDDQAKCMNLGEPENPLLEMGNDFKAKSKVRVSSDLQNVDPSTSLVQNPTRMPPEWMPPNWSVPILNLVDKVFQLNRSDWLRRQFFRISKKILPLVMEDAVGDWLQEKLCWLRNENTVAHGIRSAQDILWPNGVFFAKVSDSQEASDSEKTSQVAGQVGGVKVTKPSSFEQKLEAKDRCIDIFNYIGALWGLLGDKQFLRCANDIFYFTKSNVCIKQLTYAILELLLQSVFPELQDLLRDIRENSHGRFE